MQYSSGSDILGLKVTPCLIFIIFHQPHGLGGLGTSVNQVLQFWTSTRQEVSRGFGGTSSDAFEITALIALIIGPTNQTHQNLKTQDIPFNGMRFGIHGLSGSGNVYVCLELLQSLVVSSWVPLVCFMPMFLSWLVQTVGPVLCKGHEEEQRSAHCMMPQQKIPKPLFAGSSR